MDETYVHLNYRVKKSWQGPSTSGVSEKISPGKRYIVVHAGSENGFVPNALLVFSTKSKMADYHHDMNSENFTKWLKEKLIPNLSVPSVIVMDNASYHVKQVNKAPTMQNLKATLREWLCSKNIPFEESFTKAELLCLINENKPLPVYETEELLNENGHEVLKLPPYHCDLNPIEMIWSLAKRRVASRNMGVPASEMENLIKECFHSVTTEDWKKCTDHVLRIEEQYRVKDNILENELEPFIINVGSESDTDDTDFYEDIEYLESDLE
ncbi:uncharacterized protein [Choristoneura fumiferana]|uniref:uncharacterized protein n=1 Tax=Choristoneura fumiferana TaxID=7141 RepID=UPI003D153DB3